MTELLGLELGEAVSRLGKTGKLAIAVEVRSHKGVEGTERRVVRCRDIVTPEGETAKELTYAWFKTGLGAHGQDI